MKRSQCIPSKTNIILLIQIYVSDLALRSLNEEENKKFTDEIADVTSTANELKNISTELPESIKACQTNEPVEKLEECIDSVYQKSTPLVEKVTEDISSESMVLDSVFKSADDDLQKFLTENHDLLKDSVEPDVAEELLNCVKA